MSTPFVGEIRTLGFNFAPSGWAWCNGQLLSIAQYDAVFSLLGTTYGGDGVTTFALPNLQGQVPIHMGTNGGTPYVIGEILGATQVTLTQNQIPAHSHTANALVPQNDGQQTGTPSATSLLGTSNPKAYHGENVVQPPVPFSNRTVGIYGGSLPHNNMQPYLAVNFCIALEGIYPSRN